MNAHAHRSLKHLLIGRATGALLGLAVTALLWRSAPASNLGQVLTGLAVLEIIALISGVGFSGVVQRQVWPWVMAGSSGHAGMGPSSTPTGPLLIGQGLKRGLAAMLGLRCALAGLLAAAFWFLAGWAFAAWGEAAGAMAGWRAAPGSSLLLLTWVVVGTLQRALEELLSALMMQDTLQGTVVGMQAMRIVALGWTLALWPGDATVWTVERLIALDLCASALAVVFGLAALQRRTRVGAVASPTREDWHRGWRIGLGFWGVQMMGLGLGVPAMRLLIAQLGGPSLVAVHGAAQALADSLRNAQPLVLVGGWLRPQMVRLQVQDPSGQAVRHLALGMAKLNTLALLPLLCVLAVSAPQVLEWVAGPAIVQEAHRVSLSWPQAPSVAWLLAGLAALAMLQGLHLLVSMRCAALERPRPALLATVLSLLALPLAVVLWPGLGLWAPVLAVAAAEVLWMTVAWRGASLGDRTDERPDRRSWGLFAAIGGIGVVTAWIVHALFLEGVRAWSPAAAASAAPLGFALQTLACAGVAWGLLRWMPPLQAAQAQALSEVLPAWVWRPLLAARSTPHATGRYA